MNLSFERNTNLPEKISLIPLDSELWDVYTRFAGYDKIYF